MAKKHIQFFENLNSSQHRASTSTLTIQAKNVDNDLEYQSICASDKKVRFKDSPDVATKNAASCSIEVYDKNDCSNSLEDANCQSVQMKYENYIEELSDEDDVCRTQSVPIYNDDSNNNSFSESDSCYSDSDIKEQEEYRSKTEKLLVSKAEPHRLSLDLPKDNKIKKKKSFLTKSFLSRGLNFKKEDRISGMIKQLIETEEVYISGIQRVMQNYWPYLQTHASANCIKKTASLFENLEEIYKEAQEFLILLKQNHENIDKIAQLFITASAVFGLYLQYSKKIEIYEHIDQYDRNLIRERQHELNDKMDLISYLMTPLKRIETYVFMLEYIRDELNTSDKSISIVNSAINVVQNVANHGSTTFSSTCIRKSKINLHILGSLIMKHKLKILKPQRITSIVFMFEKAVVFTTPISKDAEKFEYWDSIMMDNLGLVKCEQKSHIFHLNDYCKKGKTNNNVSTYVLNARSSKIKKQWVDQIEPLLWKQFVTVKEKHNRETV